MDPALQSSRISKLRKRFLDVLSGSVKLDPRGASLFLEGLCAQEDPAACLDSIAKSTHGLSSVQSAMQFDLSVQFMNGLGTTVLDYLLSASNVGGDTLDNLLFHIVEPPIFWGVFVRTFQQGALSENAQLVFARMLSRLLTLQDRDTNSYQNLATQSSIQESLATSSMYEIREMGHLIQHILSSNTPMTPYDVQHGPGGRHDNDHVDFHDIAILPTADEILCQKPPFLRTAFHDNFETSESPVRDYLDNTFRMLREDMVFDIRQEVQTALQKKGKYRGFRIDGVNMVGVYTGSNDRKTSWGVKLQCISDFRQLKGMSEKKARVNFLTRDPRGSKVLRHQSPICLMSGQDVIGFGSVNRVEELLASNPPVIVLQLDGDANIKKTLAALWKAQSLQLIQISTATFAFEPVLSALKTCSVPLSKEILLWNPESGPLESSSSGSAISHIASTLTLNPSVALNGLLDLPKRICLDDAQAKSLVAGLVQRVSLIQGPPGTGKSFIGAILAKAIHDKTSRTMLVICYTNHALDQFLGDLLEYNIPATSIVRLGGRSNQLTDHLALNKQPRARLRLNWSKVDELKNAALRHEGKLKAHFDALLDVDDENLIKYLELNHKEFSDAFHVPLETEDGMTRVGRNGEDMDNKYLFSRWVRGMDAGVLGDEQHVRTSTRVWGMARSARQELLDKWRQELMTESLQHICHDGGEYNKLQETIKQEFAGQTVSTLQQKRIIACTTTGAAIYGKSLEQAGPEVLLVEEAGEILESHILISLSSNVKQMILIGDHKQLRPKVNNYQLTVEKGEGFDLNRSLFERLVLKGYPHQTLSMQHRMRPSISAFVRELTYPDLTDAPRAHGRPDIRGLQSNIIFIDHTHPEGDNSLVGDRADGNTKASKQNAYEVQMVLKIIRYLAQQGYKSEDMVILTPYLGQLQQLRDALKRDNDPVLNDLDASELARADLSLGPPEPKSKKSRIHLATIDNYQGEESNIVITSLTRSNKNNAIGFMDSPERLNVLLSRARDGLILIGNSQTFLRSKKGGPLWKRFFALLEKGQYVFRGFPIKCEKHPGNILLLKQSSDFDEQCPDGGCTAPCGFTLTCGHACPMKCHPQRSSALHDPHDVSHCKHKISAKCPAGYHKMTWECGRGRPADCPTCVEEAKRLEDIAQKDLEAQQRRAEAEAEHRRRMAELEARLEAERVAAERERQLQEEREARVREAQRKEEEARKREEGRKRLLEEHWAAMREAQREKEERQQKQAAAERRERLISERRQEDIRAAAIARAKEYDEERKREADRQRQEQERAANERRERLITERRQEDIRAAAMARAKEYDDARKRMSMSQDPLNRQVEEARKREAEELKKGREEYERFQREMVERMTRRKTQEQEANKRQGQESAAAERRKTLIAPPVTTERQETLTDLIAGQIWGNARTATTAAKAEEPKSSSSRCTIQ